MRKNLLLIGFILVGLKTHAQSELSGKALLDGLRARSIGPAAMSGRISDIEVATKKPELLYIGTAGGGIWKSISAGVNLRPVFDEYTMSIGKITLDQNHPDTVWVGTGEPWVRNSVGVGSGVYKTVNGGTNWEFMGLKDSERISDIIIHPKDPNIVFVAAQGQLWSANTERGLFKTTDGGKTWGKILYVDENTGCADIDMDPSDPNILYAAMWSHRRYPDFFDSGFTGTSALFKSTDGGKSWNKIHNGLPTAMLGRIGIAVAPSNTKVLYASIEGKGNENKGLYKSEDAGATWKKINSDFSNTVRPFYFSRLTIDPKNEKNVIKCAFVPIISTDGGLKFRQMGSPHSDVHASWIDPRNSNHILLGTDGGVYESFDQGYSFRMWNNLPVGQFYHVTVDNENPYNVYGGLQDNGSWYGPSEGASGITNSDWKLSLYGDGFYTHRHPTDKDIIYAEYQGGEMSRVNTKTGQGKKIIPFPGKGDPDLRFNWNTPLVQSPNKVDRIYAGTQFLFMSDNRGDTWRKISPDLTTNDPKRQRQKQTGGLSIDNSAAENNTTIYSLAESPIDEKTIWVGTDDGLVHVTTNQGTSWNNVTKNFIGLPAGNWCSYVEPSRYDNKTAYVAFDNHRNGDMKTYIYKTSDLGATWTSLVTSEIYGHAYVIREDLKNPNLLFAGTEFGLFVSINAGAKWNRFENNLPKVAVHDLVIHPTEGALVIATHGRGIYIVDDITSLRQITPEVASKPFVFLETKPTILRESGGSSRNPSPGDDVFYGEEPNPLPKLVYYMNKRHTFGKMAIEVYDLDGSFIKEIPAGKSAGINIVNLILNKERPRIPPSDTREAVAGAIFGPRLEAGTYKVKVVKGKEEHWGSFTLQYPENSSYALEERKVQAETTKQLFLQAEQLAYVYSAQVDLLTQAKQRATKFPKFSKSFAPLIKELETQNDIIAFKGGDFYVATESRLTERVAELYGQVNAFPGKPGISQLERVGNLKVEISEVQKKFDLIKTEKVKKINSTVGGDKIVEPLKVQSEEEFKKGSAAGAVEAEKIKNLFPFLFSVKN
jgi:photosystem II stability/assembly factor-like uncharacterized protein